MKRFIASILFSAVAAFVFAPSIGWAKTAKECNVEYKANKAAIKSAHQKKKDFRTSCRSGTETIPGGAATAAPAAPTAAAPAAGRGKTAKECKVEYKANKAAIKSSGQKERAFIAACRAGTETVPTGAANTAVPSAPAQRSAPAASPSAHERRSRRTETSAAVSASEAQAQASCPGATVVWVNTRSGIYHFKGTHNYGTTKHGTYMCEAAAKAAGDRAAENEKHP
jgi:hypothetical protein